MKKIIFTSCLLFGLLLTFNTSSHAQEGRIQAGPGLAYGGEAENLGISLDGYYTINEEFRAGAAFTYFFANDLYSSYAIDLNGNYIFHNEDELMAYGIAGLNIFTYSWDSDVAGVDDSESEIGLNLGAGLEYNVDFANLFGELKFAGLGSDANQLVLGAGLRFDIQ
ncbi:hypothetical protein [Fodinibius salsisoli]|uniref:Outer membrane protein beta-barrel domain-containing protein n=1 Tax=Fodinibius salsisoli TaxID=2820877 RepID=A0ABT3PQV8_9BACT|nr:hypothetical protein [Fodinibius salsisoli]MCW9708252.1 hypothetical protein [Fodinibius salsisoli]